MLSLSRRRRRTNIRIVAPPAALLSLRALAGSPPAASLQPGECANYSGSGGQTYKCCKGAFFTQISCFTYDYPGGRRRRIPY